jgi:hypothetical protein
MKIGDKVKVNNRTIEYTGVIVKIRWVADSASSIYRWTKKSALIQCKNGRLRANVEDLEVLCK